MSQQIQRDTHTNGQSVMVDGPLIGQILAGDQSSFDALVKKYELPLRNYIWHILKDEELVDDVLQQVFLQLYLSLSKMNTQRPLKPWLFRVSYYRCMDELRKKKRRPIVSFSQLEGEDSEEECLFADTIPDGQPMFEEILEQQELHAQVVHGLSVLSPVARSIVYLRYFGELTFSEIGKQLNIPATTVKTYFYRSLPRLRATLHV